MMSASARQKSEFMSAVLLAHDFTESTISTVKNVPKLESVNGDVEVIGMDVVKSVVEVKTYTPNPERIAFEPDLMALDIFGYENKPVGNKVKVMTDDDQFRQELLAIPGFTF